MAHPLRSCNTRQLVLWLVAVLLSAGAVALPAEVDLDGGAVHCAPQANSGEISCTYRLSADLKEDKVSLQVDGKNRKVTNFKNYLDSNQKTAILFLIDVSDPARADTVKGNIDAIRALVGKIRPNQVFGIAAFDSELRQIAPMGSSREALDSALNKVRAGGPATEFYKNIMVGAQVLGDAKADRKALVLMSDGKAEDSAYRHEDAVKALKALNIALIGVGLSEKPSDTPYLQTIERLAGETSGDFVVWPKNQRLPADFLAAPFQAVENGGRFSFDAKDLSGKVSLKLSLAAKGKPVGQVSDIVDMDANRSSVAKLMAFARSNWIALAAGFLTLLAIAIGLKVLRRRSGETEAGEQDYGILQELDGQETAHPLLRTAVRIGRGDDSDIRLINNSVSRNHAELHRRDDTWHIVDLGSTNGVRVNDETVSSAAVKAGDLVEIGEVRLRFRGH